MYKRALPRSPAIPEYRGMTEKGRNWGGNKLKGSKGKGRSQEPKILLYT